MSKQLVELLSATGRELAEGCEDCIDPDIGYWLYVCPKCDNIWCSDDPLLNEGPMDCFCEHVDIEPGYVEAGSEIERPCPRCARWREIGEMCWHDFNRYWMGDHFRLFDCKICGKENDEIGDNPHLTIPALRKLLEELGLWERFVEWHGHESLKYRRCPQCNTPRLAEINPFDFADILTDPALFTEAVISFMEGEG